MRPRKKWQQPRKVEKGLPKVTTVTGPGQQLPPNTSVQDEQGSKQVCAHCCHVAGENIGDLIKFYYFDNNRKAFRKTVVQKVKS